jgi:hypothetical protein
MAFIGIGLIPEDPPAGAFIAGSGGLLFFVGGEIVSDTLGDARPDWWPEQFLNFEGAGWRR